MFYSEALLSKTGPLARVWLSANIERKLSKTHILQSSVKDSVDAIVNPSQAPMALRLSGQLLLGVVRIYSRKARYLLDDCNEALLKLKMVGTSRMPANLLADILLGLQNRWQQRYPSSSGQPIQRRTHAA
jgi:cohesin complex subunit SCC1